MPRAAVALPPPEAAAEQVPARQSTRVAYASSPLRQALAPRAGLLPAAPAASEFPRGSSFSSCTCPRPRSRSQVGARRAPDAHDVANATKIIEFVDAYLKWSEDNRSRIMMPVTPVAAVEKLASGDVPLPSASKFTDVITALRPEQNLYALSVAGMYNDVHENAFRFLTDTRWEFDHTDGTVEFHCVREFHFEWFRRFQRFRHRFPTYSSLANTLTEYPQVMSGSSAVIQADQPGAIVLTPGQLLDVVLRTLPSQGMPSQFSVSVQIEKDVGCEPPHAIPRTSGASPRSSQQQPGKFFVARAMQPEGMVRLGVDTSSPGNGKTMMNLLHIIHILSNTDRRLQAFRLLCEPRLGSLSPVFYPHVIIAAGSAKEQYKETVEAMKACIMHHYGVELVVHDPTVGFSFKNARSQNLSHDLKRITIHIINFNRLVLDVLQAAPDNVLLAGISDPAQKRPAAVGDALLGAIIIDDPLELKNRVLAHTANRALITMWVLATVEQMFNDFSAKLAQNLLLSEGSSLVHPSQLLKDFKRQNYNAISSTINGLAELTSMILPPGIDHMKLKELSPLRPGQLIVSAVPTGIYDTLSRCLSHREAQTSQPRIGIKKVIEALLGTQTMAQVHGVLNLIEQFCSPLHDDSASGVPLCLPYSTLRDFMEGKLTIQGTTQTIDQLKLTPLFFSEQTPNCRGSYMTSSAKRPLCWISLPNAWQSVQDLVWSEEGTRTGMVAVNVYHVMHESESVHVFALKLKPGDPAQGQQYEPNRQLYITVPANEVQVSDPSLSTMSQLKVATKLYEVCGGSGTTTTRCAFCDGPANAFTTCCATSCCTACADKTTCAVAMPHPGGSKPYVPTACKVCMPTRFVRDDAVTIAETSKDLALFKSQPKSLQLCRWAATLGGKPIRTAVSSIVRRATADGFRRIVIIQPRANQEFSKFMQSECNAYNEACPSNQIVWRTGPVEDGAKDDKERKKLLKEFRKLPTSTKDDAHVLCLHPGPMSILQGGDLFTADCVVIISGMGKGDMFRMASSDSASEASASSAGKFNDAAIQAITRVTRPNAWRKVLTEPQYIPCVLLGFEGQLHSSFSRRGQPSRSA